MELQTVAIVDLNFVEKVEVDILQQDGNGFGWVQKNEIEMFMQDGIEIGLAQKVLQRLEVFLMAGKFLELFPMAGKLLQLENVLLLRNAGVEDGLCLGILMNLES